MLLLFSVIINSQYLNNCIYFTALQINVYSYWWWNDYFLIYFLKLWSYFFLYLACSTPCWTKASPFFCHFSLSWTFSCRSSCKALKSSCHLWSASAPTAIPRIPFDIQDQDIYVYYICVHASIRTYLPCFIFLTLVIPARRFRILSTCPLFNTLPI